MSVVPSYWFSGRVRHASCILYHRERLTISTFEKGKRKMKMKNHKLIVTFVLLLASCSYAQQDHGLLKKWVHPGNEVIKENGYQGAQTCAMCHENALNDIVHSVHWNLASPVRNVQGLPDSSMWGMINRECALAGSTCPANWR